MGSKCHICEKETDWVCERCDEFVCENHTEPFTQLNQLTGTICRPCIGPRVGCEIEQARLAEKETMEKEGLKLINKILGE